MLKGFRGSGQSWVLRLGVVGLCGLAFEVFGLRVVLLLGAYGLELRVGILCFGVPGLSPHGFRAFGVCRSRRGPRIQDFAQQTHTVPAKGRQLPLSVRLHLRWEPRKLFRWTPDFIRKRGATRTIPPPPPPALSSLEPGSPLFTPEPYSLPSLSRAPLRNLYLKKVKRDV